MDEEGTNNVSLDAEGFLSPLQVTTLEAHEIYLELKAAGFPESMMAGILAHMLTDSLMYREDYDDDSDDEDLEDFDDEDDDGNSDPIPD